MNWLEFERLSYPTSKPVLLTEVLTPSSSALVKFDTIANVYKPLLSQGLILVSNNFATIPKNGQNDLCCISHSITSEDTAAYVKLSYNS